MSHQTSHFQGWIAAGQRLALAGVLMAVLAEPALASGSGSMPWDNMLTTVADSITGPVAKAAGVIAIAVTGLGFAFSEGGSWMRKGIGVLFGLAVAFSASTFFLGFLGFTGGAGF
ncbi:TrbC/VirB2 family protein [Caulobacter hibisci]|uniref:TrbC/VIRB2 family protein n=1 Tax=Caulobacter hibisci TaxID=2035993 RepID=A0ABS0SXQ0_9CAUL|nr:TrbC/VirB2 family protein [Caulobacter hibisci]MBI1684201.1 TrbC/VIRB2 family protein [Caulobacter hibisci]